MKTGYEISLKDFLDLCSYHRKEIAPLLRDWFGYVMVTAGQNFLLLDENGAEVSPEAVHERIQADPDRQGSIYRVAMTLWR